MTAETLRAAASKMRERAEAATPGPWTTYRTSSAAGVEVLGPGRRLVIAAKQFFAPPRDPAPADIQHIASWHPAVALAAANLLDEIADQYDTLTLAMSLGATNLSQVAISNQTNEKAALEFANAYLGGEQR